MDRHTDGAAAARAPYELGSVLRQIAATTARSLGFRTTVINLHRPAWDDFQTVVVQGSEAARRVLLGQTSSWEDWMPLLDARFERGGAYFIAHDAFDWSQDALVSYVPELDRIDGPDAWHPEDALFVPLRSGAGEILGILAVDEPADGRRPSREQLVQLGAAASHAALALELAQQAAAATRQRAALEQLLRVSSHLTERGSVDEMFGAVCVGIQEALGFEKVCVFMVSEGDLLVPAAAAGLADEERLALGALPLSQFSGVLDPALEADGVILIRPEEAARHTPGQAANPAYTSRRNGRGPRAWNHHWLLVPLRDREGRLLGMIWADEPDDRLLPSREQRQALRAFANQAMSAVEAANQLALMRHLAEHDPLTGLRNRRGLQEHIDAEIRRGEGPVSVLVCDLDHFKRINDVLGYASGDEALRRVAAVLGKVPPARGLAARIGGEEFAIVLPGMDEAAALACAERLRVGIQRASDDFPRSLTISIGMAVSGPDSDEAAALLRDATRACVGAKRLGRNRCLAYHAESLDALLGGLGDDGASSEQLAAAMLLAETLDVRDVGTARHSETVGHYAHAIARALGLPDPRVERIRAAGVLHDIGKLGVADAVLKKPGPLTPAEWEEMRRHAELGARILSHANLRDVSGWVLSHHERVDGGGYPDGLAGDAIPIEARILAVADAYEAMTADRPYRPAMTPAAAEAELLRCAGRQFDAEVVAAFLRALRGGAGGVLGFAAAPGAVGAPERVATVHAAT
jgi:diguanylate cyclase (GGDEF)-like protein/putative nucleotidyltransferase with HDIG domain